MTNADFAESNSVQKPRAGRPRSAESRRAIIQSAMHILQNDGYAALNIEAIAAKAGVSKQTIYRWWPSAAFIVLEALTADMQSQDGLTPDMGSLKGDLLELVRPTVRALAAKRGPVFKALIAEAQADPRFAESFRTSLMAAHRETVRAIIGRAQLRGEVPFDADAELAADFIYGPILYRLLNGHGALDETFAYGLVDATVLTLKAHDQLAQRAAEAAE
ncbi:MAG: TetR/AcrR family transcriptional regulator [Alphaproteobacteria bacterium]|nr:TetR/AcrR family transcriptional regulator [Alphaproteobacteria bacterium]